MAVAMGMGIEKKRCWRRMGTSAGGGKVGYNTEKIGELGWDRGIRLDRRCAS